jgi:hypothetical protein
VYDVERIVAVIDAGLEALRAKDPRERLSEPAREP